MEWGDCSWTAGIFLRILRGYTVKQDGSYGFYGHPSAEFRLVFDRFLAMSLPRVYPCNLLWGEKLQNVPH